MANWNKLNQELSNVLDNLTDEQWDAWYANIEENKESRQLAAELKVKLHFEKLEAEQTKGEILYNETLYTVSSCFIPVSTVNYPESNIGIEEFCLAA